MLAQNFKTPADLGIKEREFDALAKVLGMMERCEIKPELFAMHAVTSSAKCGTAACIMGWCWNVDNSTFPLLARRPNALSDLFMFGDRRRHRVAMPQAAIALRSYLTHGEPRWAEALAE